MLDLRFTPNHFLNTLPEQTMIILVRRFEPEKKYELAEEWLGPFALLWRGRRPVAGTTRHC